MYLGAFFATLLAFAPNDTPPPAQVLTAPPAVVERTAPANDPMQLAAAPTETDSTTTPAPAPAAKPKTTTTRPASAKGTPPAAKPKTTTQRKAPPTQRKTPVVAKPGGSAKTPVAGSCPAGSVKSSSTGRCVPRATTTPRA